MRGIRQQAGHLTFQKFNDGDDVGRPLVVRDVGPIQGVEWHGSDSAARDAAQKPDGTKYDGRLFFRRAFPAGGVQRRSQSLPVVSSSRRLVASSAVMQVVTLCQNRSVVPYAELQAATGTASVKELEHLIIHHCIYSGLLAAKLDQRTQQLRVFKSAPRKVSPEKLDRMISSLSSWLDRARDVSRFLDGVGRDLDEEAEKAAAAGRAKALALLAAKKDRELTMLMKGKQSGAEGDVDLDGEGVPMKTDMMASTKKSKRQKKRQMDVRGDAHPDTTEQEADD